MTIKSRLAKASKQYWAKVEGSIDFEREKVIDAFEAGAKWQAARAGGYNWDAQAYANMADEIQNWKTRALDAEKLLEKLRDDMAPTHMGEPVLTDPLQHPIAKPGEQQFACILRNRSGHDAGQIDFGARFIKQLGESDQQAAVDCAFAVYEKWRGETGLSARRDKSAGGEVEAVAWMDSSGYAVSDQEKRLNGLDSLTIPLYTHPAPAAKVPEGYALLPKELTAENGAKALLMGEFFSEVVIPCPNCEGDDGDEDYDCSFCNSSGTVTERIPVSWPTIKNIWRKAVDHFATAPTPEGGKVPKSLDDVIAVQCSDGNWNYDPYMHGMANGLLLAKSCMEGKKPEYLSAPQKWLSDTEANVPEGWKMVPVEPTDDQVNRGWLSKHPVSIYKAMLTAAPTPEEVPNDN